MQANSEESSSLEHSLTLSYTESSKRLQRDQHKTLLKFWCGKNTCKAPTWYMQFLRSYCIHKSFDFGLYWKFKMVTQRSRSYLVEILMSRASQLQHDACKFQCIIIFTRSCKMLQFEYDLVQKVRQQSTSNSSEMLPFEHGLVQKVKKVRQRSTSNSSEILMWRISL